MVDATLDDAEYYKIEKLTLFPTSYVSNVSLNIEPLKWQGPAKNNAKQENKDKTTNIKQY